MPHILPAPPCMLARAEKVRTEFGTSAYAHLSTNLKTRENQQFSVTTMPPPRKMLPGLQAQAGSSASGMRLSQASSVEPCLEALRLPLCVRQPLCVARARGLRRRGPGFEVATPRGLFAALETAAAREHDQNFVRFGSSLNHVQARNNECSHHYYYYDDDDDDNICWF